MAEMVLGIFTDRTNANSAVGDLENKGFDTKDISIIMKNDEGKVTDVSGNDVADGAASGAVTGGVLGGIAGLLVGLGAIVVPGIGALLIGGPLAAALGLTGAAATTVSGAVSGALAGGLVGALVNLGVSEEDAKDYEESVKSGAILIAVPSRGDENEVRAILEDHGANKIRVVKMPE